MQQAGKSQVAHGFQKAAALVIEIFSNQQDASKATKYQGLRGNCHSQPGAGAVLLNCSVEQM
jgi:hypothetical protein